MALTRNYRLRHWLADHKDAEEVGIVQVGTARLKVWAEVDTHGLILDEDDEPEVCGASFVAIRHTGHPGSEVVLEGRYLWEEDHFNIEGDWAGTPEQIADGIAALAAFVKKWFETPDDEEDGDDDEI